MKSVVDVILVFDSCKTEMHPQKYAEGHRSYGCGAVWQSFTLSVFFCAILWMCFVISFARRTNGHAEVIEHDGEQASTSHAVEKVSGTFSTARVGAPTPELEKVPDTFSEFARTVSARRKWPLHSKVAQARRNRRVTPTTLS